MSTDRTRRRLWDKGDPLDPLVHGFTVGDDPVLDLELIHYDLVASAAHVHTLHAAGVLTDAERDSLLDGLREIDRLQREGRFEIPPELEDGHTAIEAWLTGHCGEAGRRIHTARSRNDQVAAAMRLYLRDHAVGWAGSLASLIETLFDAIRRDGSLPMPGYTHLQPAMPFSVGGWWHAHAEALLEQLRATHDLLERLDACPLGTGAGFGVPIRLDREQTARLLGFSRIQRSSLDVQNSRGRIERYAARVAADIAAALGRMAADLVLFNTREFGFVELPAELTTGSSIMPNKRNPDVLELMRAAAGGIVACVFELERICANLTSGYHRDLQRTKGPAMRAVREVGTLLAIAPRVVGGLRWNESRLREAMRPELYATHAAMALVRQGVPFRDAYRQVAELLRSDPQRVRALAGDAIEPQPVPLEPLQRDLDDLKARTAAWRQRCQQAEQLLA